MTPVARLRRVRMILATAIGARALLWGFVAGGSVLLGAALVDLRVPLSLVARDTLRVLAVLSALAVVCALVWRDRAVASLRNIALWVEERDQSLDYTLVSAIELDDMSLVRGETLGWPGAAARRSVRAVEVPAIAIVAAALVVILLPTGAVARIRAPRAGDALDRARAGGAAASRLTPLVADVTSPAYAKRHSQTLDEPSDVRALVGSKIVLRGRGDAAGIVAVAGTDSLHATRDGDRWAIALAMPAKAVAVRLVDRNFQRVIGIEPEIDAAPSVTLNLPVHDSVLRAPRGRIALAADVDDDIGIASASFEFIVSSGEGENFTFKSGTLGLAHPNARHTSLSASISLDSLGLKPGDIVHLRAVARDANNVSGPGVGTSDTRAIRIARTDEYDSVAVDAAPPSDEDKSVISERMLITLAEALEKRQGSLKRDTVVAESRAIGADQRRLRRTVGELVFTRLGGTPTGEEHTDDDSPARAKSMAELLARADSATNASTNMLDFGEDESPVVAVNKPLLEAYNAMWDATNQLEVGQPSAALPHMRRALAAIQRARQAERLYLRGRPPQIVIDVSRARLQGKDKGASSARKPLSTSDSAFRARSDRFMRVVDLAAHDASGAADSLLVLRVDALGDDPPFAAALGDAAKAIRRGRSGDASDALARARRALAGAPAAHDSLSRWSGGMFP